MVSHTIHPFGSATAADTPFIYIYIQWRRKVPKSGERGGGVHTDT